MQKQLLENLADLFRCAIEGWQPEQCFGAGEIEWAQEYMAIEQVRMGPTRVQVM